MHRFWLLVFLLGGCGAPARNVPVALDPSNPSAGESAPAPPVAALGEGPAPSSHEAMPNDDMGGMPEMGGPKPMQHDGGGGPKPMQHEMGGPKPMQHDMPMDHDHPSTPHEKPRPAKDFTCPMHPDVSSPTPGRCPKCGMKLVPRNSEGDGK